MISVTTMLELAGYELKNRGEIRLDAFMDGDYQFMAAHKIDHEWEWCWNPHKNFEDAWELFGAICKKYKCQGKATPIGEHRDFATAALAGGELLYDAVCQIYTVKSNDLKSAIIELVEWAVQSHETWLKYHALNIKEYVH